MPAAWSLLPFILVAALAAYAAAHVHSRSVTSARHRTNEYHFAHFSRITAGSKWFFPLFALARPRKFTLQRNESLWIPKGWWHWVVSDPDTIAISSWCPKQPGITEPFTFRADGSEILAEVRRALDEAGEVSVWNSSDDTISRQPIEKKDSRCIITLPGYGPHDNREIRARIAALAGKSPIASWNGWEQFINVNLWVALGRHDTGLHYDDYDGVLHVLQGRKSIRLYPPEQRAYLSPLCVLPGWAKQRPVVACYNFNAFIRELDPARNLPSARLLYESIDNKSVLRAITHRTKNGTSYVWGVKREKDGLRWELYTYFFDKKGWLESAPEGDPPLLITSIDLFDREEPVGPTTHAYFSSQGRDLSLPFFGFGTQGDDGRPESRFVADRNDRFPERFFEHLKAIGIERDAGHLKDLLGAYACDYICIHNKREDELYVQYYNIPIEAFISFLVEHDYPPRLVSHVLANRERYRNIRHEITVVYGFDTGKPVRTAFYGIV